MVGQEKHFKWKKIDKKVDVAFQDKFYIIFRKCRIFLPVTANIIILTGKCFLRPRT